MWNKQDTVIYRLSEEMVSSDNKVEAFNKVAAFDMDYTLIKHLVVRSFQ